MRAHDIHSVESKCSKTRAKSNRITFSFACQSIDFIDYELCLNHATMRIEVENCALHFFCRSSPSECARALSLRSVRDHTCVTLCRSTFWPTATRCFQSRRLPSWPSSTFSWSWIVIDAIEKLSQWPISNALFHNRFRLTWNTSIYFVWHVWMRRRRRPNRSNVRTIFIT